jgi:hypothetical protein
MSEERIRTHILIPERLVRSVDQLVGKRRRSAFVAEAVAEKLARVRLANAARRAVGSLRDVPTPGWETSPAAAAWVRASRQRDEERLDRALQER